MLVGRQPAILVRACKSTRASRTKGWVLGCKGQVKREMRDRLGIGRTALRRPQRTLHLPHARPVCTSPDAAPQPDAALPTGQQQVGCGQGQGGDACARGRAAHHGPGVCGGVPEQDVLQGEMGEVDDRRAATGQAAGKLHGLERAVVRYQVMASVT